MDTDEQPNSLNMDAAINKTRTQREGSINVDQPPTNLNREEEENPIEKFLRQLDHVPNSLITINQLKKNIESHGGLKIEHITSNNLNCLKYVSRDHGLPKTLVDALITFLIRQQTERVESKEHLVLKSSQILKFCVRNNADSISKSQFLELLNSCDKDDLEKESSLTKAILNEIARALVALIDKEVDSSGQGSGFILNDDQIKSALDDRLRYMHPNLKVRLGFDILSTQSMNDNETEESKLPNVDNIRSGAALLKDVNTDEGANSGLAQVQYHAVINQQTIMHARREFKKENIRVQKVDVHRILSSHVNTDDEHYSQMQNENETMHLTTPNLSQSSGKSRRSKLRSAGDEVYNFYQIAIENSKLDIVEEFFCNDDIKWLHKAFLSRSIILTYPYERKETVAAIFGMISRYQKIPDSETVLLSLAQKMFKQRRGKPTELNISRRYVLHAINNCHFFSTELQAVLEKFLEKKVECTLEIQMDIWCIKSKLCDPPPDFIEIAGILCEIIKTGPYDADRKKAIDLVKNEIRSKRQSSGMVEIMNKNSEMVKHLIEFLEHPNSDLSLRIQVAEILQLYLEHSLDSLRDEFRKGLINVIRSEIRENSHTAQEERKESEFAKHYREQYGMYKPNVLVSNPSEGNSFAHRVSRLKSLLIRSILYSMNKDGKLSEVDVSNIDSLILLALSKSISLDIQILLWATLNEWLDTDANSQVYIPSWSKLAVKLRDDDTRIMYEEGRIVIINDSTTDSSNIASSSSSSSSPTYISAIVGSILLKQLTLETSAQKCHDVGVIALDCLKSHPDKTTRILCSRLIFNCLFHKTDSDVVFDKPQLNILKKVALTDEDDVSQKPDQDLLKKTTSNSEETEIIIYCTSAYCLGLLNWVKSKSQKPDSLQLNIQEVDDLILLYEWDSLFLQDEDHRVYINASILEILKVLATDFKFEFPDRIIQMLAKVLQTETDTKMVQNPLCILTLCTKATKEGIHCLEAVEKSYTLNDAGVQDLCEQIFLNTLLHDQKLSEFIFEELIKCFLGVDTDSLDGDDSLADSQVDRSQFARYTQLFKIFYFANENQDVPDLLFQQLDMELTGVKILFLTEYQSTNSPFEKLFKFLETTGNLSVQEHPTEYFRETLKSLKSYVRKGMYISILNCTAIANLIKSQFFKLVDLSLLQTAVENGQHIPKPIIDEAFVQFLKIANDRNLTFGEWEAIINFSLTLLEKNQSLPDDDKFVQFCEKEFIQYNEMHEHRYLLLSIFVKLTENDDGLPIPVFKTMCKYFQEAVAHRNKILSALVRIAGQSSISYPWDEMKLIFLAAIEKDSQSSLNDIEISIRGLKLLNDNKMKDWSWTKDELCLIASQRSNPDLNKITKELLKAILKDSNKSIPDMVDDSEVCDDSTFLSNLSQSTNSDIPPDSLARLHRILQGSNSNETNLSALNIIKKLEKLPSTLLDTVSFIFFKADASKNADIIETSKQIIHNGIYLEQAESVSESCMEYLLFASNSRSYCQKILYFIYDSGLAPTSFAFSNIFKIESKINTTLIELKRDEGSRTNVLVANRVSKLLTEFMADNLAHWISSRVLTKLTGLNVSTLKSIPDIHIILSHFVLTKPTSDLMSNATLVKIIEDELIECNSKLCGLVEHTITKDEIGIPTNPLLYQAYLRILENSKGAYSRPVINSCVQILKSFDDKKSHEDFRADILTLVLRCILEFTKHPDEFQVSESLIPSLEKYVDIPVALIRKTAFEILKSCPTYSMDRMVKGMWNAIGEVDFDFSDESFKSFNVQLLEILVSISHWDFRGLKDLKNRSEWARHLLIVDYTATYIREEDSKQKLLEQLERVFDVFGKDNATQILLYIALHSNILQCSPLCEIFQMLDCICELQFKQVIVILKRSVSMTAVSNEIRELVEVNLLQSIIAIPTDPDILRSLSAYLKYLVGSSDTLLMKEVLEKTKIAFVSTCEELVRFFKVQKLLTNWPKEFEERRQVERYVERIISHQFPLDQIKELLHILLSRIDRDSIVSGSTNFEEWLYILGQVSNYCVNISDFNAIIADLKGNIPSQDQSHQSQALNDTNLISIVKKNIMDFHFSNVKQKNDIDQVMYTFQKDNSETFTTKQLADLKKNIERISKSKERSQLSDLPSFVREKDICDWDKKDIKVWSKLKLEGKNCLNDDIYILEILMIARQAYNLWKYYRLTNTQILSCLLALDASIEKPQLQQVVTGSGKSTIIAIVAIVRALQGRNVDIYTSSPVLAERDAREWSRFYAMFSLTCDHNGDRGQAYLNGLKKCYKMNIVYGDTSQFQFDTLRDEYSGLKTRGDRKFERASALIDEVDCMLIDDSSKLARLSSTLPGMDSLQILYHFIWERLQYLGKNCILRIGHEIFYLEGDYTFQNGKVVYTFSDKKASTPYLIEDLVAFVTSGGDVKTAGIHRVENIHSFITNHLISYARALISCGRDDYDKMEKTRVKIPKNLTEFVDSQIPKWVASALNALTYQENVHYLIDDGQVKPVDYKTTGVVQSNTTWSHGLHQFLQLKHSLKITSETLTTNFMSNKTIFQKYGKHLVGMTGTLGSERERQFLSDNYKVKLYSIPETHYKRFYKLPHVILGDKKQWREEIVSSALQELTKDRGVLIIMQTIKEAQLISQMLGKSKEKKFRVKLYIRNDANQERLVNRVQPGDVIVSTNLAGRGTNIQAAEISPSGGLHVILTFIPQSLRVEEQGFGRTSRQGEMGSGQLIAYINPSTFERQNIDWLFQTRRDEMEKSQLAYKKEALDATQKKNELFSLFCDVYGKVRDKSIATRNAPFISTLKSSTVKFRTGDAKRARNKSLSIKTIVLHSLEENWAIFFDKVDDGRIDISSANAAFQNSGISDFPLNSGQSANENDVLRLSCESAFYYIQLGNLEFLKYSENLQLAYKYYDEAIKLDPDFAAAGYAGQSCVLLKGHGNHVLPPGSDENYKANALKLLDQSMTLLSYEQSVLASMQCFLYNKDEGTPLSERSDLHWQLVAKMNLLGTYVMSVEANRKVVTKSLRPITYYMISKEGVKEGFVDPGSSLKASESTYSYTLSLHHLIVWKDLGDHDQIIEKINKFKEYSKVSLSLADFEPFPALKIDWDSPNFNSLLLRLNFTHLKLGEVENIVSELQSLGFVDGYTLLPIVDPKYSPCSVFISSEINNAGIGRFLVGELPQIVSHYESSEPRLFILTLGEINPSTVYKNTPSTSDPDRNSVTLATLNEMGEKLDEFCKSSGIKWNVEIYNMSEENINEVVQMCREAYLEIILNYSGLLFTDANNILENAPKQEDTLLKQRNTLKDLYTRNDFSMVEILELKSRGIDLLYLFEERKFLPWRTVVTIGIVATVQLTLGAYLFSTGVGASVGQKLIKKGLRDAYKAFVVTRKHEWAWTSFVVKKVGSLVLLAATNGLHPFIFSDSEGVGQDDLFDETRILNSIRNKVLKRMYKASLNWVISQFHFELLRATIRKWVEDSWDASYARKELESVFSRHYALNKAQMNNKLEEKVKQLVRKVTHDESPKWTEMWFKIGSYLSTEARRSSESAGNLALLVNMAKEALGAQMSDFTYIFDNVADEIKSTLNSRKEQLEASPLWIMQNVLKIDAYIAKKCENSLIMKKEPNRDFAVEDYSGLNDKTNSGERKKIRTGYKSLNTAQSTYSKSQGKRDLRELIVDAFTKHIIKLADGELLSPRQCPTVESLLKPLVTEYDSERTKALSTGRTSSQQDYVRSFSHSGREHRTEQSMTDVRLIRAQYNLLFQQ